MAISSRRIGATVPCPLCDADVVVPDHDVLDLPAVKEPDPATEDVPAANAPEVPADREFAEPVDEHRDDVVDHPLEDDLVEDAAADDDELPIEFAAFDPDAVPSPAASSQEPAHRKPTKSPVTPPASKDIFPTAIGTDADVGDDAVDEDDGFVLRRLRSSEEELDLTAMVDVVFQLLIFFMVTASFSLQKSIEVPTPDQQRKGVAQALQPLEELQNVSILVHIDDANRVTVDEEAVGDLSDLPDRLRDRMRRDQKSELILTASRQATHRTVITVVDAANAVGMQRIRMATGSRQDD